MNTSHIVVTPGKRIKLQKTVVELDRNTASEKFRTAELSNGKCIAMSVIHLTADDNVNINLSIIDEAGTNIVDPVDFRAYKQGSLGGLHGFTPVSFNSNPQLRVVMSNPSGLNSTFRAQVIFAVETD